MPPNVSRRPWTVLAVAVGAVVAALLVPPAAAAPALAAAPAVAPAAAGDRGTAVVVGIKPLDPFVVRTGNAYSGFSIELWQEIARRNGWTTAWAYHDTLPPLLQDVRDQRVDVAIAGISVTRDRELAMDFSQPMFNAGLQVMSGRQGSSGWTDELRGLLTASVLSYLLALVGVLFVAGNVIWLVTRRREDHRWVNGVGEGMFKAAAVGLAGDFGTGNARRPLGRIASVLWVISGVCFVSLFTAAVTSHLTVESIQGRVTGVSDLPGRTVLTVKDSTAEKWLIAHSITPTALATIDEAYRRLDAGSADAIVFDAPVLQHRATVTRGTNEVLVGGIFAHEDYGIAMPTGSALRKKINTSLLEMRADGSYDRLFEHYFGIQDS
jgi:polar amino acid transport system substrate-binding protein